MYENELTHYGVKGMKWGVRRRYVNADGSLNDRGIKKYAKKGYAKDSFNSNKTTAGKVWDAYTGAHKLHASAKYETSTKKQNKARAEQYLAEKNAPTGKKVGSAIKKAADKHRDKVEKRDESYAKTQKYFGVGGVALRSGSEYVRKKVVKGALAKTINAAANSYISTNGANNYKVSRGVDFVRRASINALSISSAADQIRVYTDLGKAAMRSR